MLKPESGFENIDEKMREKNFLFQRYELSKVLVPRPRNLRDGKKLALFRTTLVLAIFSPLPVAFRKKRLNSLNSTLNFT